MRFLISWTETNDSWSLILSLRLQHWEFCFDSKYYLEAYFVHRVCDLTNMHTMFMWTLLYRSDNGNYIHSQLTISATKLHLHYITFVYTLTCRRSWCDYTRLTLHINHWIRLCNTYCMRLSTWLTFHVLSSLSHYHKPEKIIIFL